jgi:phospholipid/cholesterol/gamma-HCH transport system ATP-binding protein
MPEPKILIDSVEGVRRAAGARRHDAGDRAGESLAIIGQSGSGKSVMLKCILGLLKPDRGAILVDGDDVASASPRELERIRAKFGMLFQGSACSTRCRSGGTSPSG